MKKNVIIFLGLNNMLTHKRGVENVIHFQSHTCSLSFKYYIFWDSKTNVARYDNLICIGIKKNIFWPIILNLILFKLKVRNKKIFIHSHNPLMSIILFFQTNLFTVHDGLFYLSHATQHKLNKIFWILEKILYLRCSHIHFISEYAKKMSLYNSEKKYTIIPNTSHFENYRKDTFSKNNLKKFDKDVLKIFTVRSIEERALINLIIEVAKKLKAMKIEFLIAGKGPLLNYYRKEIEDLGLKNISLLGYVSDADLISYYRDCNLVLIPAAYGEGFGLPIIEGYLFNKPVISSNICAIPDVIISKEFLFENNAESIISRIKFAKEVKNIEYLDYYLNYYSNDVIFSKMNNLYAKLF